MVVFGPARPFLPGRSSDPQEIRRQRRAPVFGARSRRQARPRSARDDRRAHVRSRDPRQRQQQPAASVQRFGSHHPGQQPFLFARVDLHAEPQRSRARTSCSLEPARSTSHREPTARCKTDFTVKSLSDTFADNNGDFRYQDSEKKNTYNLAAAVTKCVDPHAATQTVRRRASS